MFIGISLLKCFNTQPPEGGWIIRTDEYGQFTRFNTQPPEGGWIGVFNGSA